ncbi:hypothetical protein K144316041_p21460 (plasmid) [Clostridium tetani]|uniref:hypothetical protein n=1 Tax=Clostridium tetani TaxID=1513 RepID=UPI002955582C|nr:hypothetical protein [Clostridium tetani]BDR74307.1 hypothetical protein K144316041_p21460 [Clostridium tetani]
MLNKELISNMIKDEEWGGEILNGVFVCYVKNDKEQEECEEYLEIYFDEIPTRIKRVG